MKYNRFPDKLSQQEMAKYFQISKLNLLSKYWLN